MKLSRLAMFGLSLVALGTACSSSTDGEGQDAQDITKRTKPKAGMGGMVLDKPVWLDPTTFKGAVLARGPQGAETRLASGALVDFAPAGYDVFFRPEGMLGDVFPGGATRYHPLGHRWRPTATLEAGAVWHVMPAGLRIELDRPVIWSRPLSLGELEVADDAAFSLLTDYGGLAGPKALNLGSINDLELASGKAHIDRVLPAGSYSLTLGTTIPAVLQEGQLLTISLKTLSVAVQLDPVNPAFPDSAVAACVKLEDEPVRSLVNWKTAVLPEYFRIALDAFGIAVPGAAAGGVKRFVLNRLELDDVEVTSPGGARQKAKGTAFIERRVASGGWEALACPEQIPGVTDTSTTANRYRIARIPTSTGLDLPDGTYRITSTANGPQGVVTNTEEISFP
jgi:hypothetical protein